MSARRLTAFRIDPDILDTLQQIKERDGIPISEQVRRALRTWVADRSLRKVARPPAGTVRGRKTHRERKR